MPLAPQAPSRWPLHVIRASTVLAWLAVAAFVAGTVLLLVPVQNRHRGHLLQDCGSPAAFLKDGRSSAVVDPSDPPPFVARRDVASVNAHECSQLVAERAVPAAILVASTLVVGLVALVLSWIGHRAGNPLGRQGRTTASGVDM